MSRRSVWEPTTEAEVGLYEALLASDQERYFRVLVRVELLLPVSADAAAGRAPMGWATWTSNDHTHLLAFTSVPSMRTCLAEHAGAARRLPLAELANVWPNQDWWLAVNPGLPIEGFLPPWFVAQLARGDARLPRQVASAPRDRLERVQALERAKAARAAGVPHPRDAVRVSATVGQRALPSAMPHQASPAQPYRPWLEAEVTAAEEVAARPSRERVVEGQTARPAPTGPRPGEDDYWPRADRAPEEATLFSPPARDRATDDRSPQAWQPPSPPQTVEPQAWPSSLDRAAEDRGRRAPAQEATAWLGGARSASGAARPAEEPTTWLGRPAEEPTTWLGRPAEEPTTSLPRREPRLEEAPTPWASAAADGKWAEPAAPPPPPVPAPEQPASANGHAPDRPRHAEPDPDFVPANQVEADLFAAAEAGKTDSFLSTLLLATVYIPKGTGTENGQWRPQPIDGEPHLICYTSSQHLPDGLELVSIKFIKLIMNWPDPGWSFAVNPGTPVGATLPGGQLLALASWAKEVGLARDDDAEGTAETAEGGRSTPVRANPELTVLQKAIAPSQINYYLERGYDRVSGFVHRAHEVSHLRNAQQMRRALGLDYAGSPFTATDKEIYLMRWAAYRPNLYRIPYGGQTEAAMKAMEGWVIERAPFRGNGFAPGESKEIIAEFKVDSARLPHGTRLIKLRDDGEEITTAVLDADGQRWVRKGSLGYA